MRPPPSVRAGAIVSDGGRPAARRSDAQRRWSPVVPGGGPDAVPLPAAFAPYAWAATVAEVAARHGLEPAQVLKFDQNTPPLPGVPQVPLAESFATLNRVSRRASTASFARPRPATWHGRRTSIVAGSRSWSAPAPTTSSCSARSTFLAPGAHGVDRAADLRDVPHRDAPPRAARSSRPDGASLLWRCNPENPTGAVTPAGRARRARAAPPECGRRRRRGVRRVRR